MKIKLLALIFTFLVLLNGCDTGYGISRIAKVDSLPDFNAVVSHIKKYPEIEEVKYWQNEGGRPLTFSGIQQATQVYYISYKGSKNIAGTIHFTKDYEGNIAFQQYLIFLNRPVPKEMIEATVPIMQRIEKDLEEKFGFTNLQKNISVNYFGTDK